MINEPDFSEIYAIMESSFPASECRTFEAQKALLKRPSYRIITEKNEQGNIVAFLAGWEFAYFRFVEHIAVDSRIRGGGLGKSL